MYIYVYLFEKHKLNIASNISVKAWKGLGVACTSQGIHPCDQTTRVQSQLKAYYNIKIARGLNS